MALPVQTGQEPSFFIARSILERIEKPDEEDRIFQMSLRPGDDNFCDWDYRQTSPSHSKPYDKYQQDQDLSFRKRQEYTFKESRHAKEMHLTL